MLDAVISSLKVRPETIDLITNEPRYLVQLADAFR